MTRSPLHLHVRFLLAAVLGALMLPGVACICCGGTGKTTGTASAKESTKGSTKGSSKGSGKSSGASAGTQSDTISEPAPPDTAHQTDETAGKGADMAKIAVSPKNGSPYLGVRNELVVVNVFSDFQCPVCTRAADPVKQLAIDFPGKVRVVFRNNPLQMHQRARPAALAAAAAGKQGKFWQFHDKLFADQQALDEASLKRIAQEIGLDMDRWEKDRADPRLDERITAEAASVVKLGAPGTPGIFVNGIRSLGWGSYQGLKMQVASEIASGEQLLAQGTPKAGIPAARIRATASQNPKSQGEGPVDPDYWVQVLTAD